MVNQQVQRPPHQKKKKLSKNLELYKKNLDTGICLNRLTYFKFFLNIHLQHAIKMVTPEKYKRPRGYLDSFNNSLI